MNRAQPRIRTCSEWGALPRTPTRRLARAHGVIIHHTAGKNREPRRGLVEVRAAENLARQLQRAHLQNGWTDTGHHFTISRGGVLLEGRHGSLDAAAQGHVIRGAHAGDEEGNSHWYGLEFEGRYDLDDAVLPDAQWDAAVRLITWLSLEGGFDSTRLQPHNAFRATLCPGRLTERLPELRTAVHDRKLTFITKPNDPTDP